MARTNHQWDAVGFDEDGNPNMWTCLREECACYKARAVRTVTATGRELADVEYSTFAGDVVAVNPAKVPVCPIDKEVT